MVPCRADVHNHDRDTQTPTHLTKKKLKEKRKNKQVWKSCRVECGHDSSRLTVRRHPNTNTHPTILCVQSSPESVSMRKPRE